jgi:hypothetical protein
MGCSWNVNATSLIEGRNLELSTCPTLAEAFNPSGPMKAPPLASFALGILTGATIAGTFAWLVLSIFWEEHARLRAKYMRARRQLNVIGKEVVNRMLVEIAIDNGTLPPKTKRDDES